MKKVCFVFALAICFVFALSGFWSAGTKMVYAQEGFNVLAFGDSISAGYAPNVSPYSDEDATDDEVLLAKRQMLTNYMSYYGANYGTTASKSAHSYCFAKSINQNAIIKSYANSGDTSTDLANMLTIDDYEKTLAETGRVATIKTQIINSAIQEADAITLCIGANDVLGVAIQKLTQLIANGDISYLFNGFEDQALSDFSNTIAQNVETFKNNYTNKILPVLTAGAKVYVMTIYTPYIHLGNAQNFTGFKQLLNITINGLNQINKTIRDNASKSVVVVDVAKQFNDYTASQHKDYVNADLSQFNIFDAELIDSFSNGEMPYYMDPHPTPLGQQTIATMYQETYIEDTKVPMSSTVIVALAISFGAIVLGISAYLILEKLKYRAIKF